MLRESYWACMALARRHVTSSPSSLEQLKREAEQCVLAHAKAGGACVEVVTCEVLDRDRVQVELVLRTDDPGVSWGEVLKRFLYTGSTAELALVEA